MVEEGWVQEAGRGAGIDQRADRYKRVVGKKEMNEKREMAWLRIGERCGDWKRATQPDPYWLVGWSFFGWLAGGVKVVWEEGRDIQGPGKGPC